MTSQKWFFWNYGFYSIFENNLSVKISHAKEKWLASALTFWDIGVWSSICFMLNSLIYCLFLKLGTNTESAVYIAWWGLKVRLEMFAEWWRHTLELWAGQLWSHGLKQMERDMTIIILIFNWVQFMHTLWMGKAQNLIFL